MATTLPANQMRYTIGNSKLKMIHNILLLIIEIIVMKCVVKFGTQVKVYKLR